MMKMNKMIQINTVLHNTGSFIISQKVFNCRPPRILCNYSYSSIPKTTKEELIVEVYDTYRNAIYNLSSDQLYEIINLLINEKYELSPFKVINVKNDEFDDYCCSAILDSNHFYYFPSYNLPGYIKVVKTEEKDLLVLNALTLLLLNHTLYDGGCASIDDQVVYFHDRLKKMRDIHRLYRINITTPISKHLILDTLPIFFDKEGDDTYVYKLIESFLNLPYYDNRGNKVLYQTGRPVTEELNNVLDNMYLHQTFDRELATLFPGVSFTRHVSQVFIAVRQTNIKYNSTHVFNEQSGYALLKKVGLTGKIVSICPGDAPIACYDNQAVSIDRCSETVLIQDVYHKRFL